MYAVLTFDALILSGARVMLWVTFSVPFTDVIRQLIFNISGIDKFEKDLFCHMTVLDFDTKPEYLFFPIIAFVL